MTVRVLLVDDHAVTRYGLRALLETRGYEIAGEASEGREALRLALREKPDIVLMDVTMPGLNGIEATINFKRHLPDTRVIVLSMHRDSEHVHRAISAGASGYVLKGSPSDEVIEAVRAVQTRDLYLSPELQMVTSELPPGRSLPSPIERLSAREREVLQLVVEGYSSADIAKLVHLSTKSIDSYRSRLMKKLGISDVTALVKFAVRHGLTPSS